MSTMIANVERLKGLVTLRMEEDAAKVAAAQAAYDDALDKATSTEGSIGKFVSKWVAKAISTKEAAGPLTNGEVTTAGGYVTASRYGREVQVSVQLPADVEIVKLPFNPADETDEVVAATLGTRTPEFHSRTLQVLDVNEGDSITIETSQFGYYL